ncbi:ABC transporter substrate-binding protein [Desulfocurvus sp. DL9XJH121]
MKPVKRAYLAAALAAIVLAWVLVLGAAPMGRGSRAAQAEPVLFLTTAAASTPQMPFWRAVAGGTVPGLAGLRVEYWKNLDDLRGALLAGKGDIWLGHVEGFAQAARRGAPVRLLAVTGWRKFSILSARPGSPELADLAGDDGVLRLAVAPPQSPAVPVLRHIAPGLGLPPLEFIPLEPRQLQLEALRGGVRDMLAPEPQTTILLDKVPGLRVVASVEDLYGRAEGCAPRLPVAGIAVHADLESRHPGLARDLLAALVRAGAEVAGNTELGVEALPDEFQRFLPRDVLRRSLARDVVLVRPARDCRDEILRYLRLVAPREAQNLPKGFFWDGP